MKLTSILTALLKEQDDVQQASQAKTLDASVDFNNFKRTIDSQINAARGILVSRLSKLFVGNRVIVRASKGTTGQIEKDYTLDVKNVDVSQMGEDYHVIFKGTEGDEQPKDYYINLSNKVKMLGKTPDTSLDTPPEGAPDTFNAQTPQNLRGVGFNKQSNNIISPQNMGLSRSG